MRNGLIYRKRGNRVLFFVPRAIEQDLLHKYHNDFGHFGTDKTLALLQEGYWFPNMKAKVQDHKSYELYRFFESVKKNQRIYV